MNTGPTLDTLRSLTSAPLHAHLLSAVSVVVHMVVATGVDPFQPANTHTAQYCLWPPEKSAATGSSHALALQGQSTLCYEALSGGTLLVLWACDKFCQGHQVLYSEMYLLCLNCKTIFIKKMQLRSTPRSNLIGTFNLLLKKSTKPKDCMSSTQHLKIKMHIFQW